MDKWYVGYPSEEDSLSSVPQLFQADHPKHATPEASGYESVIGPFDTKSEALEAEPNARA